MTSDFRPEVESSQVCACALKNMQYHLIYGRIAEIPATIGVHEHDGDSVMGIPRSTERTFLVKPETSLAEIGSNIISLLCPFCSEYIEVYHVLYLRYVDYLRNKRVIFYGDTCNVEYLCAVWR